MSDAITVMEQTGMTRQVPTPPFPQPATYGTSREAYDEYLDAVDRGDTVEPSPALVAYLDARTQHLQANYDAQVIPRHKLWTNDSWLITPVERVAARPHAPSSALDRRQRPIPCGASGWTTWTVPAATAGSGSTDQHLSSTPDGARHPRTRNPDWSSTMPEESDQPRYPDIQVQLTGQDGNAFAILGRTTGALRRAGLPQEEIDDYVAEATSGDYDHLLQTTMRWIQCE